jgi:hypothetical protein
MGKLKSFICHKISLLISTFQGMKQIYLYLWHLYFNHNGKGAINEITKSIIVYWKDIIYISEREIKGSGCSWLSWSHHFEHFTVAIMTWLTFMEYLRHVWPRICSTCRNHFTVLSPFIAYHRGCSYINTTCATSGADADYCSRAPEFTHEF